MSWIKVLSNDELVQGERRVVKTESGKVLMINFQGTVYAVGTRCPHMKLSMKRGKVTDDGAIVCPFHRSAFDLKTGAVKDWTPFPPVVGKLMGQMSEQKALPTYATKVEDGSVWVDL